MFKKIKDRPVVTAGILAGSVGMKFVTGTVLAALFGIGFVHGLFITIAFWGLVFLAMFLWKRSKRKWFEYGRAEGLANLVCAECTKQAYLRGYGTRPYQG